MPQAHSSTSKGLPGVAINEDSLREAASETPPRNLFNEVLEGKWALVVVSPEMLITPGFNQVIMNSAFQQHLCLVFIDECHLVDEQGDDFRPCYKLIGLLRSRVPTHIPWIAVSATLPPGRIFDAVMELLGFHANHYIHRALPIDNHQICYIPKILRYPVSGTSFLDLAWLIPPSIVSLCEITKTLIFCETIELGSRLHHFLRCLLPHSLCRDKEIIQPYHSLLSRPGRTAVMQNFRSGATRIVVGTDCFTWGVDVPDIRNVVVFGLPSSFSKLVQQIGRAGRDGGQAYAITYAARWVEDVPEHLRKATKQEITNLKRREAMCPVLRHWFNASPESCPRTIFCDHFCERISRPKDCCVYHNKTLPSMEPTESRVERFSPSHARAPTVRSDGTYQPFKEEQFSALRDAALRMIAVWARQTWEEVRGEDAILPSTAFFPEALQKRLSEKIHVVTSLDKLCGVLYDWRHLDSYKIKLFKFCEEVLKGLDGLRQEMQDMDEVVEDEQETQPVVPLKIKVPGLKQRAHEENSVDVRPQKRQCR